MSNERLTIEKPFFWVIIAATGVWALATAHLPSMITTAFFFGIVIPSQIQQLRKRGEDDE